MLRIEFKQFDEMDEADSLKEVTSGQGRLVPLSSLKVFELKEELGRRGLDKTGVKVALIERLLMVIVFLLMPSKRSLWGGVRERG